MVSENVVDPFEYEGVVQYKPSAVVRRIARQGGHFTLHGPPTLPLDEALGEGETIERVVITKGYRRQLLFELDHYGINKLSLFHDLDGLSEYLNWTIVNRQHWTHPPVLDLIDPSVVDDPAIVAIQSIDEASEPPRVSSTDGRHKKARKRSKPAKP